MIGFEILIRVLTGSYIAHWAVAVASRVSRQRTSRAPTSRRRSPRCSRQPNRICAEQQRECLAAACARVSLDCRHVSEAHERRGRDVLERHMQLAVAELELLDARRLTDAASVLVSGAELNAINCNMS